MCGLVGWVAYDRDLSTAAPLLDTMTDALASRGPDGRGTWISRSAALGHRRLVVIDPQGGAQPMTAATPCGTVTLVHSGEVYNVEHLRDDLRRRGHRFRTASDTEVVLRGFLEWERELPDRLEGMFAFAIWDGRSHELFLVRDRLGVKPLYYQRTRDGVLFASEPKAILSHPEGCRLVDVDALRRALTYAVTIPGVPWASIREVEPGGVVVVGRDGLSSHRYWRLATEDHGDDRRTTACRTRELLQEAVGRQLVADVPLGVLLSGGLDSSTLAAMAVRHTQRTGSRSDLLDTYDVDVAGHADHFQPDVERVDPDAPYVATVVDHLGSRHRTVRLEAADVASADLRRDVVRAYDAVPGFGDRDRSMYLFFRGVRESSTVVLSGEAGDELFGGYAWFLDPRIQRAPALPWVAALFDVYGPAPGLLHPAVEEALDLRAHLAEEFLRLASEVEHRDGEPLHERRMRVATHAHVTRALPVLLDRADRLSMACGLEVRVPYCDHRLVQYVYNTPWTLKSFDGREKSLLRAVAADLLPPAVLHRRKSAYPSTLNPRHLEAVGKQAADLAARPGHPVFEIVRRGWLADGASPASLSRNARARNSVEWVLNLAAWFDVARPQLRL